MTGKDTSEAPASGPEDSASELAKVPTEPLEEVAASETTGAEQAPVETPQAPAPTATKPAPWSEDLPSAPLLLSVEGVSETSVTVTWEPPERLGRLGLQGYILELRREGASEWVPVNERPMMVTQQTLRNLVVGDKFFLRVAAVSSAGAGPPAVLDQPVHIHENIEAPKIRVPRHLRQTYLRQVGEAVNLQIPFQGNPKPQASWTHNGHALDSQRVNVRNGDRDSILFIRSVQRSDSGCYELTVRLEGMEARASINILVIGMRPGQAGSSASDPELMLVVRPGGQVLACGGFMMSPALHLAPPDTLVLQRNQDRPAALSYWMSGAAMLPLSGHHPRTQATQSFWATQCKRRTRRQGNGSPCWSATTRTPAPSLTSSWATRTPSGSFRKTCVDSATQPPSPRSLPTSRKCRRQVGQVLDQEAGIHISTSSFSMVSQLPPMRASHGRHSPKVLSCPHPCTAVHRLTHTHTLTHTHPCTTRCTHTTTKTCM
ncbi:myosin-binding protein H isoform X1 [Saccopteryx leptura]|uniref:myosin-binding protein H isoform X1 n=1 Tax=Saccopteryx leptura TaxID=249018 RepID=UPI00339C63C6